MIVLGNGKDIIATEDEENRLVIWKIESKGVVKECKDRYLNEQYQRTYMVLHSRVTCIALSNDDSKMITGHWDGSLQLWDTKNMTLINDLWTAQDSGTSEGTTANCISFNGDGTRIVLGCFDETTLGTIHDTIEVRDVNTGELVCPSFTGHTDEVTRVKFVGKDNSIVSSSRDKTVRVWKIDESISNVTTEQIDEDVSCVTCSADESCFVTGHPNGRLSVWDATTGQLIRESAHVRGEWIWDIAVTPDGRWIFSVGVDSIVRVSDWESLEVVHTFEGHTRAVTSVEISKHQEFAATTSHDGTIRIWDLIKCDGSHQVITSSNWDYVVRCFISSDDKRIVVRVVHKDHERFVEVWAIGTSQSVLRIKLPAAFKSSREDILSIVGEPRARAPNFERKVFIRQYSNEIRYGDVSDSIVLGTTESCIEAYSYSSARQVVAVGLDTRILRLLKLDL